MTQSQHMPTNKINLFASGSLKGLFFVPRASALFLCLFHQDSLIKKEQISQIGTTQQYSRTHTHTQTQCKGQFGGAVGGLGLWLGKSSGNVLGATPALV